VLCIGEDVRLKLSFYFLPQVHRAVGVWSIVFEDTTIAHELHHTGDIMTVESLVELKDETHR